MAVVVPRGREERGGFAAWDHLGVEAWAETMQDDAVLFPPPDDVHLAPDFPYSVMAAFAAGVAARAGVAGVPFGGDRGDRVVRDGVFLFHAGDAL